MVLFSELSYLVTPYPFVYINFFYIRMSKSDRTIY